MSLFRYCFSILLVLTLTGPLAAQPEPAHQAQAEAFSGLSLRLLGPAVQSGRVVDVAKDPTNSNIWYVATASGGVWKTRNAGTTWRPIFDRESVYSTGCVTVDPRNPHVVWVGSGENNSQRSVGWGDGVYKSLDGGASWRRMGLETSEHIGKIVLDPRDSDVVWVAAQGPLWSDGGERGLYRSDDGGETWTLSLEVSPYTGVTDVVLDPRDPDVIYAAAHQRRRRQWTLIAGGPESAIYKSTDGGATWRQLRRGLPSSEMGRIGLALSPHNPDVVYATIPAADGQSGFYRSTNRGESWTKQSDWVSIDPQYYQELFPDPHRQGRIYAANVFLMVSDDEGRNWRRVSSEHRHVDDHALLFDADDPNYLLVGGDGGLYESFDRGSTWRFVPNLPITQFYRVEVDYAQPFYNVYGGTQDNGSLMAPSRTFTSHGIRNSDWINTLGADGYQTRIDPAEPDIFYAMIQYGGLVRYDRLTGETLDIQPQPEPGEPGLRWNWDSPLVLSSHGRGRLYFAAQRIYRTDDHGNSWRPVSEDLSRQIDRNQLEVMGRVWSVDAVWKNVFTSPYGSIVSLDESTLEEGLLYAGTDDGLLHVGTVDGETSDWRTIERFPGVPEGTLVSDLVASRHHPDRVFALFNAYKSGDFQPYVLVSDDRGGSWRSLASSLPEDHVAWSIVEDHEDPDLLFLGTEFGLFWSGDRGESWTELTGGVPTISFRDLAIQRRENDLVVGTFGRGIYVLDDYTPLRFRDAETLAGPGHLFPVRNAPLFLPSRPIGWGEKGVQGDAFFTASNPPYGAVFSYHLRDGLSSRREQRRAQERAQAREGVSVEVPSWDALRAEDEAQDPEVILVVRDASGDVVRRLSGPTSRGFHRVAWDLRYSGLRPHTDNRQDGGGPLAAPGSYQVELFQKVDGTTTSLASPQSFDVVPLGAAELTDEERAAWSRWQHRIAEAWRVVLAADAQLAAADDTLAGLDSAIFATPGDVDALATSLAELRSEHRLLEYALHGDPTRGRRQEPAPPSVRDRIGRATDALTSTVPATETQRRQVEIVEGAMDELSPRLRAFQSALDELGEALEAARAKGASDRR